MARKSSVERANSLTGGFALAQKNVVIQYGNDERRMDDILAAIRSDAESKGIKDADFSKVDVYVKPEEKKVFYVINEKESGSIDF